MSKNKILILLIFVASLVIAGCNVGMAPAGASGQELQNNFNKLPKKDRITLIKNGPGTAAQKQAQIDKINAEPDAPSQ